MTRRLAEASKDTPMFLESLSRLQENEARLRQILLVLAKYGLADWLGSSRVAWLRKLLVTRNGQRLDQFGHEERIRLALLELGTTFVKFGQMLSTRPDLVGGALATELSKLQSSTPADPINVVRRTIEAELGRPPEELFEEFSSEAMASASIAQVHTARLRCGQNVVVKVQHHGIEATIHRDLNLLLGLASLAQKHAPALRPYRPVNTVREFRRTLLRELDLTAERHNIEEFTRNFANDVSVCFPKAYPDLSSRRVLTMDLLDGVLGCDVGNVPHGEDVAVFTRRMGTMYVDMIFRDGFFHADPHPGNYVIMRDGVAGLLDFGMVGRLDEGLREDLEGIILAVTERDVEELTDRVVHLGAPPPDLDRQALQADLAEFVAEYTSRPIKELNLAAALGEVLDIVARYHIFLPANMSLLLRTLMVLEGTARQLDPAFSLMDLIHDYQTRHAGRWDGQLRWFRDMRRTVRSYDRLFRLLPVDLADSLHRFRIGTFELKHEHRHLQASVHRLVEGLLAAAMMLSAALLLGQDKGALATWLRPMLAVGCLLFVGYLIHRLRRSIKKAEDAALD